MDAGKPPQPWGGPATLVWLAGGFALAFAANVLVVIALSLAHALPADAIQGSVLESPSLVAMSQAASLVVLVPFFVLAARAAGVAPATYLGLKLPLPSQAVLGLLLIAALYIGRIGLAALLSGAPPDPARALPARPDIIDIWLLTLAAVVLAPIQEEIAFRGFAMPGLARSWGVPAAILVTSALWTALHFGTISAFGIGTIFLLGVGLGWVRLWSGSTLLTIALHAVTNGVVQIHNLVLAGS